MLESDIFKLLEQHDFDTSFDWQDPEIGLSADELLAMAEWQPDIYGAAPEARPMHYAPDLHINRLPDWVREPVYAET